MRQALVVSEVAAWWAALERAAEAEAFFSAVLGFIAAGAVTMLGALTVAMTVAPDT